MNSIKNLEAVTTCIGYDDFLAETVKWNIPLFDRWIIVTDPSDTATREVCRKFNLQCLLSEDGKKEKADFAKGRLIDRALKMLSADSWRLHIDADIALPHRFRHLLEMACLQEDMIYGIDRVMVKSWEQWQKLLGTGYMQGGQYNYQCYVQFPEGFQLGTRWANPQVGWCPIGFFQMWHGSQDEWRGTWVKSYPTTHNTGCRTDVQHALQWDRTKRALIPEAIGVHLESEDSPRGANWKGRKSKRFGPKAADYKHTESFGGS